MVQQNEIPMNGSDILASKITTTFSHQKWLRSRFKVVTAKNNTNKTNFATESHTNSQKNAHLFDIDIEFEQFLKKIGINSPKIACR